MKTYTAAQLIGNINRRGPKVDFTGMRFGSFTVLGWTWEGKVLWRCVCDCGAEGFRTSGQLKTYTAISKCRDCPTQSGKTKPRKARASWDSAYLESIFLRPAGLSERCQSRTYSIWSGIKQRCRNPNSGGWRNYGGRGIKYDPRWESFDNFLADMGEAPEGLQIDRINNDGDYTKENCRWVTQSENMRNTYRAIKYQYPIDNTTQQ